MRDRVHGGYRLAASSLLDSNMYFFILLTSGVLVTGTRFLFLCERVYGGVAGQIIRLSSSEGEVGGGAKNTARCNNLPMVLRFSTFMRQ